MSKDDGPISKYQARIPSGMYEELVKRADKNRRSINDEILIMLEDHLSTIEVRRKGGDPSLETTGQQGRAQ